MKLIKTLTMAKLNQERQFEWMKLRRKYNAIGCIFDTPILIILWYLDYKTVFWILLLLFILNMFGHWVCMKNMANKVGIEEL